MPREECNPTKVVPSDERKALYLSPEEIWARVEAEEERHGHYLYPPFRELYYAWDSDSSDEDEPRVAADGPRARPRPATRQELQAFMQTADAESVTDFDGEHEWEGRRAATQAAHGHKPRRAAWMDATVSHLELHVQALRRRQATMVGVSHLERTGDEAFSSAQRKLLVSRRATGDSFEDLAGATIPYGQSAVGSERINDAEYPNRNVADALRTRDLDIRLASFERDSLVELGYDTLRGDLKREGRVMSRQIEHERFEAARPPKANWYELKTRAFSTELSKLRNVL